MTSKLFITVCSLIVGFWPLPASAQIFESVGVRAQGMAGAFVAVADDATATFWNPAGLATAGTFSLVMDRQMVERVPHSPLLGAEDATSSAVALGTPPLGLSYYRLRVSEIRLGPDPEAGGLPDREDLRLHRAASSSLVLHQTGATLLQSLGEGFTIGTTFKFVRGIAADDVRLDADQADKADLLDQATELVGQATNRLDLDIGLMVGSSRMRLGVVARNLREPEFDTPSGGRIELSRQLRAGLAIMPSTASTLAVDVDLTKTGEAAGDRRSLAVGAEQWLLNRRLGLRGGLRGNTVGDARMVAAGGVSVAFRPSIFAEAQLTRGSRDGDRGWGVGVRAGF